MRGVGFLTTIHSQRRKKTGYLCSKNKMEKIEFQTKTNPLMCQLKQQLEHSRPEWKLVIDESFPDGIHPSKEGFLMANSKSAYKMLFGVFDFGKAVECCERIAMMLIENHINRACKSAYTPICRDVRNSLRTSRCWAQ